MSLNVSARSISEEFSSGDTGRYQDEECLISHGGGREKDNKQTKDRDERDEGLYLPCIQRYHHINLS